MLSKDLIFVDLNGKTSEDVLSSLVDYLVATNIVMPEYKTAILEREAEYPTGIYTDGVNVAIPHADYQVVNEDAIAVAVLKEPVKFARMEDPDSLIDVSIVIMLAIVEPHGHIEKLAKVSDLVMNQELLSKVVQCSGKDEIYDLLMDKL